MRHWLQALLNWKTPAARRRERERELREVQEKLAFGQEQARLRLASRARWLAARQADLRRLADDPLDPAIPACDLAAHLISSISRGASTAAHGGPAAGHDA